MKVLARLLAAYACVLSAGIWQYLPPVNPNECPRVVFYTVARVDRLCEYKCAASV